VTTLQLVREEPASFCGMLGSHPAMLELFDAIRRAANSKAPVVISGPTGCGKELVARAAHSLSDGQGRPFCPVNVAALPEALVESELFGSVRGAFTGALADRPGLVEAAAGGTLFLDEAGELARPVQAKLLRVLEVGEFRRVGAVATTVARFRLVVAVQIDAAELLASQAWREDFYYRVTALVLRIPPLAERRSDIPLLARSFAEAEGLPPVEAAGMAVLQAHDWPGNVRELQRTLLRAAHQAWPGALDAGAIHAALATGGVADGTASGVGDGQNQARQRLLAVCEAHAWQATHVAAALAMSRATLYRRLGELGISLRDRRKFSQVVVRQPENP
jgi:DNA-binding NtrC family response regulator